MKLIFCGVLAVLLLALVFVGAALRHELNREPLAVEGPASLVQPLPASTDSAAEEDAGMQQVEEDERRLRELGKRTAAAQPEIDAPDNAERVVERPRRVDGAKPTTTADTKTLVSAETCGGRRVELNLAEKRMFELHNETRKERGLRTLCLSPELTNTARAHSYDMLSRDYFDHNTPEGITPRDRMLGLGSSPRDGRPYEVGNENIALGSGPIGTPENRFRGFMNSPGHRAGIVNNDYSEVGIGALAGSYQGTSGAVVYTVNFGGWR